MFPGPSTPGKGRPVNQQEVLINTGVGKGGWGEGKQAPSQM